MTSSSLLSLAQANSAPVLPSNAVDAVQKTSDAGQKFSDTLASALNAQTLDKSGAQAPAAAHAAASADADARARHAFQLDGASPVSSAAGGGDAVLNGLQRLRGAFDGEISKLSGATAGDFGSSDHLFKMQAQFASFSMLMEVSSKVAGKGTQAFESLLKGQ